VLHRRTPATGWRSRTGASAVGLVSAMPSGPGVIPEDTIAQIAAAIPPGVDSFLLTSLQDPAAIVAQHARCRTTTLQLCDQLAPGRAGGAPPRAARASGWCRWSM